MSRPQQDPKTTSPCPNLAGQANSADMRETFRAWMETTETFFLEVIFEQRRGKLATLLRGVLFGLSKIFEVIVKLRRFLYNVRIFRDSTLGIQVIAVGNLTVGGTGKTPVVENSPLPCATRVAPSRSSPGATAPNRRR